MSWHDLAAKLSDAPNHSHNSQNTPKSTQLESSANIAKVLPSIEKVRPCYVLRPRQKRLTLNAKDRAEILNWLHFIGETREHEIIHTLQQCESDPVAREWFIGEASKVSLFRLPEAEMMAITGRKYKLGGAA